MGGDEGKKRYELLSPRCGTLIKIFICLFYTAAHRLSYSVLCVHVYGDRKQKMFTEGGGWLLMGKFHDSWRDIALR